LGPEGETHNKPKIPMYWEYARFQATDPGAGKSAVYELRVSTGRDPVTGKYGQVSRRWPG